MWMKHAEHGGIQDLPDLPYWRAQGWEPTDETPPEPDTLRDPGVEPPEVTEEHTEAPEESTSGASSSRPPVKSAKSAATEESDSDR